MWAKATPLVWDSPSSHSSLQNSEAHLASIPEDSKGPPQLQSSLWDWRRFPSPLIAARLLPRPNSAFLTSLVVVLEHTSQYPACMPGLPGTVPQETSGHLWERDGVRRGRWKYSARSFPTEFFFPKSTWPRNTNIHSRTNTPRERKSRKDVENNYGMLPSAVIRQDMANPLDLARLEKVWLPWQRAAMPASIIIA